MATAYDFAIRHVHDACVQYRESDGFCPVQRSDQRGERERHGSRRLSRHSAQTTRRSGSTREVIEISAANEGVLSCHSQRDALVWHVLMRPTPVFVREQLSTPISRVIPFLL